MDVKRKHERYKYELGVDVVFEDGETHPARLLNFSLGGAFIQIEPRPDYGSKITLLADLPGVPETCKIPCFVRWFKEDEGGMGVQFEYTRPIEVWALSKLIRKLKGESES